MGQHGARLDGSMCTGLRDRTWQSDTAMPTDRPTGASRNTGHACAVHATTRVFRRRPRVLACAPSLASSSTTALPMPRVAPVTRAVRPASPKRCCAYSAALLLLLVPPDAMVVSDRRPLRGTHEQQLGSCSCGAGPLLCSVGSGPDLVWPWHTRQGRGGWVCGADGARAQAAVSKCLCCMQNFAAFSVFPWGLSPLRAAAA